MEGTLVPRKFCENDMLKIYNKYGENDLPEITTLCGSLLPDPVSSDTNVLRLEFTTDDNVQQSGFAAVFQSCKFLFRYPLKM